jgi:multicomponent K+:H+ antiporter subunit G
MSLAIEILFAALLVVGAFFSLVGSIGLLRLSDFLRRLHGPTKATTLGVGGVLLASIVHHTWVGGEFGLREVLITLFLFLTAPVSAHLLAKAALALEPGLRPDQPGPGTRDPGPGKAQ